MPLPVSVREVVGRRVARLGTSAHKMLTAAAVIGREFDLGVLAAVTELDEDALVDLLDEAAAAAVVTELPDRPDRYSFAHALIQRTLHDELSTARRRRVHRRVAEALEAAPTEGADERVGELARHWYEATQPADGTKAFEYALRAGDRAQRHLAPSEAVRWYTQAVELADRCSDPGTQRSRGFFSRAGSADAERIAVLDRALDAIGREPSALRAQLLARLAVETYFAPGRDPAATLDEALAMSAVVGDADARLDALFAIAIYYVPENLGRRLELLAELRELVARGGDPGRRFWCGAVAMITLVQSGQVDAARGDAEELRLQAAALGDPAMIWAATFTTQMLVLLSGDLVEAERLGRSGLEIGLAAGQPDALMISGSQLTLTYHFQGREADRPALIEAALAKGDTPVVRAVYADALASNDRLDEARGILDRFAADGLAALPADPLRAVTLCPLTEAAVLCGHTTLLDQLPELLEPIRSQVICSGATIHGPGVLWLAAAYAALGHWTAADVAFDEAVSASEAISAPYLVAKARSGWARMLQRRGHPGDAERCRSLAGAALEIAERHGFGGIERSCRATLATLDCNDDAS
jgi:tetratricopeptide (TPR) repeat protein